MKTALEKGLLRSLRELGVSREAPILVGASGGADSTALVDGLARQHQGSITIAHLNHLLRGAEADGDAEFVTMLGARLGLGVVLERRDVAAHAGSTGRNLEAVAREVRYEFLARAAEESGATLVATAHTRDDQVETICMRLLRGTGPGGLRGIQERRSLSRGVTLIRPILEMTRAEVIDHCMARELEFRTDSSNREVDLVRNRTRHDLIPHLRSFNPRIDEALLRMAALIADDDEVLSAQAVRVLEEAGGVDGQLSLRRVSEEPRAIRRRVLRLWLQRGRGDLRRIDAVHVAAVERLMLKSEGGRKVELPGGFCVTRRLQGLVLEKTNPTSGWTG